MDIKKNENIYLNEAKPRKNAKEYILKRSHKSYNLKCDSIPSNHKIKRKPFIFMAKRNIFII